MAEKRKKIIMLNTLLLIFCCVIIALFCWSPKEEIVLEKYKINFETDGGSEVAAIEIEEGSIPEKPEDPTKDGYVFVGWMLGDELYDFTTAVEGDVTLKAVWKELDPDKTYYIITIDYGDGTTSNQPVEEGTVPIAPTNPTRPGYNFLGWELNGEPYDFTTPVTEDATIVAKWEEVTEEPDPNEDREYTVRFNLNGGNGNCPDQKVKHGQRATNNCNPTRDGYTLTGWSPNINTVITRDVTFNAQWSQNSTPTPSPTEPDKYQVTYYLDGAQVCTNQTQYVAVGSAISPNCSVTARPHYTVSGQWSCSSSTMQVGGVRCDKTSSLNSFAIYCNVIYDGDYPTPKCSLQVKENGNVIIPSAIYAGGRLVTKTEINTANDWPKLNNITIDYDGLTGISVTKK